MSSFTLNLKGNILEINTPKIMGILNITPDSFFDGGKFLSSKDILQQTEKMLNEGAAIIDVGGMSSRPGAELIPEVEEQKRVINALEHLVKEFPQVIFSVDTWRSRIAEAAVQSGASMINDISAGQWDDQLFRVAAQNSCTLVLMHMPGNPGTMHQVPEYKNFPGDVLDFFRERIAAAKQAGLNSLVIDPGFGFAKTLDQNYRLLRNMPIFNELKVPILVGVSRKRMIANVIAKGPEEALNATTAVHMLALLGGARLLRVHDVAAAAEAIMIWNQYISA